METDRGTAMEKAIRFNPFHNIITFPKTPSFECDGCRLFAGGVAYGVEVDGDGKHLFVPVDIPECPLCRKPLVRGPP